jgi:hypothetical protein
MTPKIKPPASAVNVEDSVDAQTAEDAEYYRQIKADVDVIFAHKVFKDVAKKDPLEIGNGGSQATFLGVFM